ncbi:MAG TPA: ABC transporter ATP-binding protein [Herpetosiphon sp.]|uniref:ABC transporter related n=1 Tax=Herpetosiphon aurantiacus (strain ATCC 23779 / DSM 785 / 114-95) TaxID=316274 RepID=A9AZD7_HERA2|nr:ABC transporter ATP-binding protein [Herpetosiphon sp.]ABX05081.1 ABC transporter related [Herpetosiphon aurantiacus DSM 785]HBW48470.1 ABC transporter ATP-binding protein [Herpetosiphon sp.]
MSELVVVENYRFRYAQALVELGPWSFGLAQGECVLLLGANGAGKSTVCRLLNGLIPYRYAGQQTGSVSIAGHATEQLNSPTWSQLVGSLSQRPANQILGHTVARDLAWSLAQQGLPRPTIAAKVSELAERFGLLELLQRQPQSLSGGEIQRLALANLLARNPILVVLDEPCAALDAAGVQLVRHVIQQLQQQGTTVVIAEQRPQLLRDLATRALSFEKGQLIYDGTVSAIVQNEEWSVVQNKLKIKPMLTWHKLGYKRNQRPIFANFSEQLDCTQVGLVGPNGSGKTSLLQLTSGVLRPQTGWICYQQRPINQQRADQRATYLASPPQDLRSFFYRPTVAEELTCADPTWREQLIERFGLAELLARSPFQLSGGEQRRVALACALLHKPKILLLDEPTAGLDYAGRWQLRELLQTLAQQVSALISSHDLAWLASLTSRWLRLPQATAGA